MQPIRPRIHKICGQAISVPILEAPGQTGVGRFGWKDQHASLLSFSGDALWYAIILTALEKDRISHHGEGSFSPDFRDRCRRENDRSRWSPANGGASPCIVCGQLDERLIGRRASTNPSPRRLRDRRVVRTFSLSGTRSWISVVGNAPLGRAMLCAP